MNLHLILLFLIRLALAVNLSDSKPNSKQQPVRKCNLNSDCDPNQVHKPTGNLQETIKSVKQLELTKPEKPPSGLNEPKKKGGQRKRANLGVRDARGDAKLSEFILRLNKELYEKVRKPPIDHSDQINRLKISSDKAHQHDKQHSNDHNAQHYQLRKPNSNEYDLGLKEQDELSAYLKEQKVRELQRQAFDSLQQIFEIDLPANPTFNQKFIELITALLNELRHIKSRLWQANCKMRLSFTNQQIFSDCETNHEEPCNCPKSVAIGQPEESDEKDEESGEHYQAIGSSDGSADDSSVGSDRQAMKSIEQETPSESFAVSSSESSPKESSGSSLTKSTAISQRNSPAANQTAEANELSADNSENKKRPASKSNELTKSSPALITAVSPTKPTATKSKKETELSKQLRSAIDCFLCKHQWTNCLNYGIKCPAE